MRDEGVEHLQAGAYPVAQDQRDPGPPADVDSDLLPEDGNQPS